MSTTTIDEETTTPSSLTKLLQKSLTQLESSESQPALRGLLSIQSQISTLHLFSPETNETLDDISTSHLPLLAVEHHLGVTSTSLPTSSPIERHQNVTRAMEYHHSFLRRMEQLNDGNTTSMDPSTIRDYHSLINDDDDDDDDDPLSSSSRQRHSQNERREDKMARYKRKKQAMDEITRLTAMRQRRNRLGLTDDDTLDGYDGDDLLRNLYLVDLRRCCEEAIDEIRAGVREMEMLTMAVEMEQRRQTMEMYKGVPTPDAATSRRGPPPSSSSSSSRPPLTVTHITQHPQTGQLTIRKEDIRAGVFRPGWNQPTMTLEELGEIEVARAMEREAQQKVAEEEAKLMPRRYDQLVRDGMEDDADLVDKSAALDRKWDEFREDNPRGMGNKMKERGDRNF